MKTVPALVKKFLAYDQKTGIFTWKKSRGHMKLGLRAGHIRRDGYVIISFGGRAYLAHRLAWFFVKGCWPLGYMDHVNRDKKDNRIVNLREANHSQNSANVVLRSTNTSGVRGVYWDRANKLWRAQIHTKRTTTYLGSFSSKVKAAAAYRAAAAEKFGEFMR